MALTHALSTNNYGPAHLIVATSAANGTHTTLASAMADSVSGDTIFLRDSVTENVTLTAGVNIAAWTGGTLNTPTITGTLTMTTAGTCNISGIRLQTNSAALLAVTGSAASIVNVNNCYLNCTNNTGITFSSSSSSAQINLMNCHSDLGTTGIALYSMSSAGSMQIESLFSGNSGGSTTQTSNSAGTVSYYYSALNYPISSTGTGTLSVLYNIVSTSAQNSTSLTFDGSGTSLCRHCQVISGTASAISIGAGANLTLEQTSINSSNANAVSGLGTLNYLSLTFDGSSSKINTTTQTGGTLQGGQTQAPSTGFLGQSITNSATNVATTTATAKTITSIALTPGIWDVSAIAAAIATGGTAIMTAQQVGISTTDNTLTGTLGIELFQINVAAAQLSGVVPQYRVTLTANTTYYLVVANFYTSTTCPTNGRISATRVG